LHTATPEELKNAGVIASMQVSSLIDAFDSAHQMRDWYTINADHPTLVQHWTRKLTDPAYQGPKGARLQLKLRMPTTNTLTFVIIQNEWRSYRGPRKTFVCEREVTGSEDDQTLIFEPSDFANEDGSLASWDNLDQFAICRHYNERGSKDRKPSTWTGPPPTLMRLEWK
jgi:hypothetical protein